ncbi:MAG: septum formation protein Maf [Candidatus Omnitrophica bacterium]|nr:septum formation protein Maf [Candidatus Omnitrophota bacterium]
MPKKPLPILYLASASLRRREILQEMNIPFRSAPSAYHERRIPGMPARQLVMWHAASKALHARLPRNARFVLGADTVALFGKKILGKPRNIKEAFRMLRMLSSRPHFVLTGIAILDCKRTLLLTRCAVTKIWMKPLSVKEIRDYFKQVNPLDKAGAFGIQEGPEIIKKIKGSYSNVMGLPKELMQAMMKELRYGV